MDEQKKDRIQDILQDAKQEADLASMGKWFAFGFFFGPIGLLIAYLNPPQPSVHLIADLEMDERDIFRHAYSETAKKRQGKIAIYGLVIGYVAAAVLLILYFTLTNNSTYPYAA